MFSVVNKFLEESAVESGSITDVSGRSLLMQQCRPAMYYSRSTITTNSVKSYIFRKYTDFDEFAENNQNSNVSTILYKLYFMVNTCIDECITEFPVEKYHDWNRMRDGPMCHQEKVI